MSYNEFLERCNIYNFRPDEIFLVSILLNNFEFINNQINLLDLHSITKQKKYKNIITNLIHFTDFAAIEYKINVCSADEIFIYYSIENPKVYFHVHTYDQSYAEYISELIIHINDKIIMSLFLEKNILSSCEFCVSSDYDLNQFDNFFDCCLSNKSQLLLAFDMLYRGMIFVCTNGLNDISKRLKKSRHVTKIIPVLYKWFKSIRYTYGMDALEIYHPDICNVLPNNTAILSKYIDKYIGKY